MARAPWKYVGGKTRMLPLLREYIPSKFGTYFEPMIGSGAVFYDLEPPSAWIGDMQLNVAEAHRVIQGSGTIGPLIKELRDLQTMFDDLPKYRDSKEDPRKKKARLSKIKKSEIRCREDMYYWVRHRWNSDGCQKLLPPRRVAMFIFLAKTCFNGVWRKNKEGKVNTPFGRQSSHPKICDEVVLGRAHEILRTATVHLGDFSEVAGLAQKGDLVYMDPPYDETYDGYTGHGFGIIDLCRVAETARECARNGAKVLVTNSNTDLVVRAFSERGGDKLFDFYEVAGPRSVSRLSSQRSPEVDLLIASR